MADNPPFSEFRSDFENSPLEFMNRVPGIFPVNKRTGMTSHDVVAIARKRLNMKKVGHGGTLDPLASGLLLILAGRATRLFDSMQNYTKTYRAGVKLGIRTDTQDITGEIISENPVGEISREQLLSAMNAFRGDIRQIPPMYSALKKGGIKLCDLARKGKVVEREPRDVSVYELELLSLNYDEAEILMTVSKGFYVRTLIDDIGEVLGCGATMASLVRTAIGPFNLEQAVEPDLIAESEPAN